MSQAGNAKEDPCDILGLPRDSTIETVRKARKELAKRAHPDSVNYDPLVLDILKRVNANLVKWEECVREGRPYLVDSELPLEEEDPFADLEERKKNLRAQSQSKYMPQDGQDIEIRREIDLGAALNSRLVTLKITGELKSSVLTDKPHLKIRIPANFVPGETLKLRGKGKPGLFGGNPGDLYVTLVAKKTKVTPPSPQPTPQPTPPPRPQPTPPLPPTPRPSFIEDSDVIDSSITPVENMGSQVWWKLAIASVSIFILASLIGGIDSPQPKVNYPNEEQTDQEVVSNESELDSIEETDYEPETFESDGGATGEIDDPFATSETEESDEGDSGVTGEIGNP